MCAFTFYLASENGNPLGIIECRAVSEQMFTATRRTQHKTYNIRDRRFVRRTEIACISATRLEPQFKIANIQTEIQKVFAVRFFNALAHTHAAIIWFKKTFAIPKRLGSLNT